MIEFLDWCSRHWFLLFFIVFVIFPIMKDATIELIRELRGTRAGKEKEEPAFQLRVDIGGKQGGRKAQKKAAPRKPRIRIKEGGVYHVSDPNTGKDVIVHAADEQEAKQLGARSMGVSETDLDSTEVYDRVIRK